MNIEARPRPCRCCAVTVYGEIWRRTWQIQVRRSCVVTMFGPATPHEEEQFWVALTGAVQAVLSRPVDVRDLQARLMVCMYTVNEHRGKTATLQVLRGYRVWQDMEKNVANLGKKCLRCQAFKAGEMVQRPVGEVLHGGSVDEVRYTSTFCTLVRVDYGIRNVLESKDVNN